MKFNTCKTCGAKDGRPFDSLVVIKGLINLLNIK